MVCPDLSRVPGPADEESTYPSYGSAARILVPEDLCRRYAHAGLEGVQVHLACSVFSQRVAGVRSIEEADGECGSGLPVENSVSIWRAV